MHTKRNSLPFSPIPCTHPLNSDYLFPDTVPCDVTRRTNYIDGGNTVVAGYSRIEQVRESQPYTALWSGLRLSIGKGNPTSTSGSPRAPNRWVVLVVGMNASISRHSPGPTCKGSEQRTEGW